MNKLTIFCNGGLGNRFGALVGGLIFGQQIGRKPTICWPENNWCGCSFKDIFDLDYETVNIEASVLVKDLEYIAVSHLPLSKETNERIIHPNQIPHTNFSSISDNIIYNNDSIPVFFNNRLMETLRELKVSKVVRSRVEEFCSQSNINRSTIGIHFRKTDKASQNPIDDNYFLKMISENPNQRYFICSDDEETESKFKQLPNVITKPKDAYVEKLVSGHWRTVITDKDNNQYPFNVNRGRDVSIAGFVDMLILSRTNIQCNGIGSFLKFAKLFSGVKKL